MCLTLQDTNKDDPTASKKFVEITEAYEVLGDDNKRKVRGFIHLQLPQLLDHTVAHTIVMTYRLSVDVPDV